jgi:hypothetical protein
MGKVEGTIIHKRQKTAKTSKCSVEPLVVKTVILLNITAFNLNKNKEILK